MRNQDSSFGFTLSATRALLLVGNRFHQLAVKVPTSNVSHLSTTDSRSAANFYGKPVVAQVPKCQRKKPMDPCSQLSILLILLTYNEQES